jgi:hypothetical protein
MTTCAARVQLGTFTYIARNSDRACGNRAQANGFCHRHQPPTTTPAEREAFEAVRASLTKDLEG